jgi:MFS family permease
MTDRHTCIVCGVFGDLKKLCDSPRELWLVFAIKFFEGLAMFSFLMILVKYLSGVLGLSDEHAGWLFALLSGMQLVFALGSGVALDVMGTRRSLFMANGVLFVGRFILAVTSTTWVVVLTMMTLLPLGMSLQFPGLLVAVRRFTSPENRATAFGVWYVIFNVASLCASLFIYSCRRLVGDIYVPVLWACVVATAINGLLTFFMRDLAVDDSTNEVREAPKNSAGFIQIYKEVLRMPVFWRFCGVVFLFILVKMIFGHLKATVPKWMTREYGEDTPFELFIGINSFLIIALVSPMTHFVNLMQLDTSTVLIIGAWISGLSPMCIVIDSETYAGVIAFICMFSLGEALWNPRLYQYTATIPPEGREGPFAVVGMAQLYAAKFCAGISSGYLLGWFCPGNGRCDSRLLWLSIAGVTVCTPILLTLGRPKLFIKSDETKVDEQLPPSAPERTKLKGPEP